jgi:phytoene/squalene synthetase
MERRFSMTDPNPNQNLRELLERLHNELEQTESMDEDGNEMLRHLAADIRRRLERSGAKREADDPILERLQDTIERFEATHPSLTQTLSEMMTILSNAGI